MPPLFALPMLLGLLGGASGASQGSSGAAPGDLAALLALLNASNAQSGPAPTPAQLKLPRAATAVAIVVVSGFFVVLLAICGLLLVGKEPNPALYVGFGALLVLVSTVVCFLFGSSWGSRVKDLRSASAAPAPIVLPAPQAPEQLEKAPSEPPRKFSNIVATVFGGAGDPQKSAYDGHLVSEDEFGVALPARFGAKRPKVQIWHGGKSVIASIVDVGPWNTSDPYWETGARPQAESGTDKSGRKTNKAGIDLTPGTARALGLQGKGLVDWAFVEAQAQPSGQALVELAKKHIGEKYQNVLVPKNDGGWKGPWDCAEFASWLVWQMTGQLYGCVSDSGDPAKADAYTGAWKTDAKVRGRTVSVAEAAGTPGAFLLRYPPAPGEMGHIAVSDGAGGTVEAASAKLGVIAGQVNGRRWDTGVLVPGIDYSASGAHGVSGPEKIYAVGQPNMAAEKVKELQRALAAKGFDPGEVDGEFGTNTALAVAAFQRSNGLITDGEVGAETSKALGVEL